MLSTAKKWLADWTPLLIPTAVYFSGVAYATAETARVLSQSSFPPGTGIVAAIGVFVSPVAILPAIMSYLLISLSFTFFEVRSATALLD